MSNSGHGMNANNAHGLIASDSTLSAVTQLFTAANYPSQLLVTHTGSNPLLAATAPLLAAVAKLQTLKDYPDITLLQQQLSYEVKAFEINMQTQGYSQETRLIARYLLCTSLDELIQQTPWGQQDLWQQQALLLTFHQEAWGGERFFSILERLQQDAKQHIDLLELGYICLKIGFQGKYRQSIDKEPLYQLTETIYQTIRWHRGEISKKLLISPSASRVAMPTPKLRLSPLLLACAFVMAGCLLLAGYLSGRYLLAQDVHELSQHIAQLTATLPS